MNHSYPVDFFALGVIAYEFMTGKVLIISFRGLMSVPIGNKFEKKYWLNRSSLTKYHLTDGAEKVSISLIDSFNENLKIA
jgi:serine/threonine protein kinase